MQIFQKVFQFQAQLQSQLQSYNLHSGYHKQMGLKSLPLYISQGTDGYEQSDLLFSDMLFNFILGTSLVHVDTWEGIKSLLPCFLYLLFLRIGQSSLYHPLLHTYLNVLRNRCPIKPVFPILPFYFLDVILYHFIPKSSVRKS